jgi:hypothetical protein
MGFAVLLAGSMLVDYSPHIRVVFDHVGWLRSMEQRPCHELFHHRHSQIPISCCQEEKAKTRGQMTANVLLTILSAQYHEHTGAMPVN